MVDGKDITFMLEVTRANQYNVSVCGRPVSDKYPKRLKTHFMKQNGDVLSSLTRIYIYRIVYHIDLSNEVLCILAVQRAANCQI